jgi:hypothetical protein
MQLRIKLKYYTHSSGASLQILATMHARQKYLLLSLARSYACLIVENPVNNSVQQSSSLEVRVLSAGQDLYRTPWKTQVHCSGHNSLPLSSLLSEIQPPRALF